MKQSILRISGLFLLLALPSCSDEAKKNYSSSRSGKDARASKIQLLETYLANGKQKEENKVDVLLCADEVVSTSDAVKKDASHDACQPISCVVEEVSNDQGFVEAVKSEASQSRAGFDLNKEEGKYKEEYQIFTQELDDKQAWVCQGPEIIDDSLIECSAPGYAPGKDKLIPTSSEPVQPQSTESQDAVEKGDAVPNVRAPITCGEVEPSLPVAEETVCNISFPAIYVDDKSILSCSATAEYKKDKTEVSETIEVKIAGGADKYTFQAQLAAKACKLGSKQKAQEFLDTIKCKTVAK